MNQYYTGAFHLSVLSLYVPCRTFLFTVHNYLTNRDYSYSIDDLCDLMLLGSVSFWLNLYRTWDTLDDSSPGKSYSDYNEVTRNAIFTYVTLENYRTGKFNILLFLSIMVVFIWTRFLLMLQLTRNFGPMLRIILSMAGEVFKFLLIWAVVLVCLTSVATLLFGELEAYRSFVETLFLVFDTGLGNYDMSSFDDLSLGKIVGEVFLLFAVLVNCIVLLNFIIAILADTYSKLSSQSLGIYYDGVIARIPVYEDDSRYGGLIVTMPPFNVLAIFMVPFYVLIKDEKKLRKLNDQFTQVMFAPSALIITLVFAVSNLLLVPFAYFGALYKKLRLLQAKNRLNPKVAKLADKEA